MVQGRRIARRVLAAALLLCGLLIVCRTIFGPLTFPFSLKSPMNVEGWFGLCAILLVVIQSRTRNGAVGPWLNRWDAFAVAAITCLTASAFYRAAAFYFLSDDFILLKYAKSFSYNFHSLFATPGGDGFYRPLAHVSMALTSSWAGVSPVYWHWIGFALHAANSILVFFLARALRLPRLASAFAAALFAVHGTRPEAVIWVAARSDLLATFFVLIALVSFIISWNRPVLWRTVSLVSMILAFFSKESSYTFPLVLLVFLASNGGLRTRRGWYSLAPFFAVAAGMLVWRWILFGGIGGYLNAAGQPQALSPGVLPVLKIFALRLWAVFFFPVNWSQQPEVSFAILTGLYVLALFWLFTARITSSHLFVSIGFLIVLALPPLTQLLIGPDLQKARYLYLPSAGFCLLLAATVQHLKLKSQWAVSVAIVLFNIAALFHNMKAWEYASQKAQTACSVAASCGMVKSNVIGLPGSLKGVYFFANGFRECVEMQRNGHEGTECVLTWDANTDELSRR
jgi:protein O-mannosyl-transferase